MPCWGWRTVTQGRKQAVGDRTARWKYLNAVSLLKPVTYKTTLLPATQTFRQGLWFLGVQPKDYQTHVFLAESSGITTVTDSKKENAVRKTGDQSRRLHLHPGTCMPMGQKNFKFSFRLNVCLSNRIIRLADLNVTPAQSLWEKNHSPPALQNELNWAKPL